MGRIGAIGKEALEKQAKKDAPLKELMLHGEHEDTQPAAIAVEQSESTDVVPTQSAEDLQEALRLEAFGWPRLVFPPLKRSGHIILDSCTAEG